MEHLRRLGVAEQIDGSYSREEAVQLLQGNPAGADAIEGVHGRLSLMAGNQLLDQLSRDTPQLGDLRDRIAVRTLPSGESSASFRSFPDDSHAVLVSRALQESFIALANVIVYLDITTRPAGLLFRKRRMKSNTEAAARLTAALRYVMLGHRMLGRAPRLSVALDDDSFVASGEMAIGAVMFVIAHEVAHIFRGDSESSTSPLREGTKVSESEMQELQADGGALKVLVSVFEGEATAAMPAQEIALWSAFAAILATQITERAIYVRRNRTHPEAWARWAVLEKSAPDSEPRVDSLRLGFMMGMAGAMNFQEQFPDEIWAQFMTDGAFGLEDGIDLAKVKRWDRLNTCPLEDLMGEVERVATPAGRELLGHLAEGNLAWGISGLSIPDRRLVRILDPELALEFATLRRVLDETPVELTTGDRDEFSVAAVRLAAESLEGGFNP